MEEPTTTTTTSTTDTVPVSSENNNNTEVAHQPNTIKVGDNIIINVDSGEYYRIVKIKEKQLTKIGKVKNVDLAQLVGHSYYSSFQLSPKGVIEKVNMKQIELDLAKYTEGSSADADNRKLTNINTTQKLTSDDITELKQKGANANTIIEALISNSDSYHTKTSYSQMKYLKKKLSKYTTFIKVMKPTAKNLFESYYTKDARKICNLRYDAFGQMLTLGNIRSGIKVLLIEATMGLVTGAIAERMGGGEGSQIITSYTGKGPSLSITGNFGLPEDVEKTIYPFPMALLSKLNSTDYTVQENIDAILKKQQQETAAALLTPTQQSNRNTKKQKMEEDGGMDVDGEEPINLVNVTGNNRMDQVCKGLVDGVDSLMIVTRFNPLTILAATLPFLQSSRPITIFSLYLSQLMECYQFLSENNLAIHISINEIWMREQQVLPKRTHPMMNMDGASGYILSAIKLNTPIKKINAPITTPSTTTTTTTTTNNGNENKETEEPYLKRKRDDDDGNKQENNNKADSVMKE